MMVTLVTANNYLLMFVGWEGVGVCSYLLVCFWFTRIAANQSSLSAFLTNRVGDCFLTIGIFTILWSFGKEKKMLNYLKKKNNEKLNKGSGTKLSPLNASRALYQNKNQWQKKSLLYKRFFSTMSCNKLGPYLAGLIEGDGHIAVHNKNSKSKLFRPKIIITFNNNDKPLADKLSALLKVGNVIPKRGGCVILQILGKDEVLKIINLINGYMRTPKIEALHRAIAWINEKDNSSIPLLGLDLSPVDSNSWLAGFTDADGNFSITLTNQKKNSKVGAKRVQTFFRIELKQNYSKEVSDSLGGISYFNILTKIAALLGVNLYTRTRYSGDKVYYSFMVISHNFTSHVIVRNYFDRFPLYSSKYLAYKDWCLVQDLQIFNKGRLWSKEDIDKITFIKSQFNNKRKSFDFLHLDNLTF